METEGQSVAQDTTVTTEVSQATEAPAQLETQTAQATQPEVKDWTPNYKVKAYDNEYEIPEGFRAYINKENEKNFREVFEKFYAVDHMKGKLEKTRTENESLKKFKGEYDLITSNLSKADKFLQNKDFGSLFNFFNLDIKDIQTWMYNELKKQELPPDQQALYNQNNEYLKQKYTLEEQAEAYRQELESLKAQQQEFAIAKRGQELDSILNRPEIASVAKNFDAKLGQAGAFRNEVIRRAAFEFQSSGKDMSPEEAVNEALKTLTWDKANEPSNQGDRVLPPQANQKKPTLPNLQGKATSPVSQQVKSIEDLKKLRNQSIRFENQ